MARLDRRHSKARIPFGLLWLVFGAVALFFAIYEVIERTWLADVDMQVIHFLHLIRGIGACIIMTVGVVWYTLRSGLSIFPSESPVEGWALEGDLSEEAHVVHLSGGWFIRMRWIACIMGSFLVIVTIPVTRLLDSEALLPLSMLILGLVLVNVLFTQMLKRQWCISYLAEIQIGTDLVILTAMLHFSGGIENPMCVAYIFHVIIGGILLDWRKCYAIALTSCALFAGLAFAEMGGFVKHYTLLIMPHGQAQGRLDPGKYERLRELLQTVEGEANLYHVSNDALYVSSVVILQTILLTLTAYFITTIMEHLRAGEKQRRAGRQRLERVIQATGAGFAIVDRYLQTLWLNDQMKSWLGLSDGNTKDSPKTFDQRTEAMESALARTFQDGVIRTEDRFLTDAKGNRRFFETTIAPLKDSQGEVFEVVELTHDITERKMLEAEALHSGKLASLGLVASGIAHEVRNPLSSISTRLRLLERKSQDPLVKESLPLLHGQIDRISRILSDISSFSRQVTSEWSICEINTVLSEVLTILRFHSVPNTVRIDKNLALLPDTLAIRDQLVSVFLNLGLNALEAMQDGGCLTIESYAEDGEIFVVFKDTGPGVKDELQSNIFNPFFSTKESGSGLGLSIVRKIMKTHKGRIEFENNPDGGAVFTVVFSIIKDNRLRAKGE